MKPTILWVVETRDGPRDNWEAVQYHYKTRDAARNARVVEDQNDKDWVECANNRGGDISEHEFRVAKYIRSE